MFVWVVESEVVEIIGPSLTMSSLADLFINTDKPSESSQELERKLFDCLRLRNGVYKTTYAHRLDDLNAWVEKYLPAAEPLQLLDIAISSGTSTLEWVESLEEAKLDYHMTGNDLTTRGLLVSFGERLHAVLDHTRWPLLFEIDGQWLSSPPRKRHRLRYPFALAFIKCALFCWSRRHIEPAAEGVHRTLGMRTRVRPISLVTPRLSSHPRVTIKEGNIMGDSWLEGKYHVIRAANILNRKYFTDDALVRILGNLRHHLAAGGILVVCRTDTDGKAANHATIFHLKTDMRLEVVSRMNGGSEIENLVLQLGSPPQDKTASII